MIKPGRKLTPTEKRKNEQNGKKVRQEKMNTHKKSNSPKAADALSMGILGAINNLTHSSKRNPNR